MKFFNLLAMGMIVCSGVTVQAQTVFQQDFSAEQTAAPTDPAYYEFINLQKDAEGNLVDKWGIVDGALSMENSKDFPCTNQTWQRAIKFRNLPLKEKTLYKMTFDINPIETPVDGETFESAPGYVDVKLMQGDENADICIIDAAGAEQRANIALTKGEPQTISKFFYFADLKAQNEKYEANCAGKELYAPEKFFAGINVYSPGKYTVDNFLLEEASPLEKIEFNKYNIRMGYVGATNAVTLLNGATRKIYDASLATVKVNGVEVEIEDVELQKDGLYIFTVEEIPADAEVVVTLNAPEEVQFAGGFAGLSLDADGVKAEYSDDAQLADAMPFSWAPAEIVSTTPAEGSFALPTSIEKFTFEFDHEINGTGIVAKLSNGKTLEVLSVEGKVVTLLGGEFPKGAYTIELENVVNAGTETPTVVNPTLSFETGEIQLAERVYTPAFENLFQGEADGIPTGWKCMVKADDAHWTGGTEWAGKSACRNFIIGSGENTQTAFYLCDRDGWTYLVSGDTEENRISLPAGNVEFSVLAVGHESPSRTLEFRIEDLAGNVIAEGSGNTSTQAENFTSVKALEPISITFNNPVEQNIVVKIHEPQGGYTAARVVGIKAQTYVDTEGEKFEPEVVFDSHFTGSKMPEEGSGWLVYENNNPLQPGSDRKGTSGILERNFHQKMQSAAFFRECGANEEAAMRLEYGNGNGVEGGFHMDAGKYELTYYAGTWNDPAGHSAGTSKVFMDLIDAATGNVVFHSEHVNIANFENGDKCEGQADKITEKVSCAGGNFIVKLWGTNNTVLGSLSITKEGSQAAKWYSKLAEAVGEAETELATSESEELNGAAKDALKAAIDKYKKPSGMYTDAEFQGAIDELAAAQADMKARRDAMGAYNTVKSNIAALIEKNTGTKYENLESFKAMAETYTQYAEVAGSTLENSELIPVTNELQLNYNKANAMITDGVGYLTAQINGLVKNIIEMGGAEEYASTIEKANQCISDDQELAHLLRLMYTKKIYDAINAGNPFVEVDSEMLIETPKTIPATDYVHNPSVYVIAEKHDDCKIANYPGWESDNADFAMRPNYGWGGWNGNAYHLINGNDMFVGIGYVGNDGVNVWNNVECLPVGVYDVTIKTMDRSGAGDWDAETGQNKWPNPERQLSTISVQQGENEAITKPFANDNLGQYYGFTDDTIEDVTLDGEVTADVKIGAYIHAQESFAAIRDVQLTLKGKKEGFDYAAAAQAVQAEIEKLLGAGGLKGDVNGDTLVNSGDINAVLGAMSGESVEGDADVNSDTFVNSGDINAILEIMSAD